MKLLLLILALNFSLLSAEEEDFHYPQITLSMIVKNEEHRYLKRVLESAKEYISCAVIIDDGSSDNTPQVCQEILGDIPLTLIINQTSTFSNEVVLRAQLWAETIKTNPEWILVLDADEIFEDKFKDYIHTLLSNTRANAIYFRLFDFWNESHYREDYYWKAHLVYRPFLIRYLPDIDYKWKETSLHCGRFPLNINDFSYECSDLRLKHYGWSNPIDRKNKYSRYLSSDPEGKYGWLEQYESILDENPNLIEWNESQPSF